MDLPPLGYRGTRWGERSFGAWTMREEGLSSQRVDWGPYSDSVAIVLENISTFPRISFPMKSTAL